ncbi:hypothetical protein K493DRAFT_411195 [Basidiobolus meristosporus CBS 931.73]|uniref:Secreted protein n=1 Tax=Basidiobolus meristosporus CBS 931.73 TaxID=1314790 RepID=A0A1Y1XNN5_9FUNG|nr:hypothetical protein K493DRAFT_411195 [Basidiobolus meristosporus CBS 931.73]|eukprot:ORX87343.1 hypothetical protein K493DRAFT_411195 [Basidiobolus meristosporus CBS 931.73]
MLLRKPLRISIGFLCWSLCSLAMSAKEVKMAFSCTDSCTSRASLDCVNKCFSMFPKKWKDIKYKGVLSANINLSAKATTTKAQPSPTEAIPHNTPLSRYNSKLSQHNTPLSRYNSKLSQLVQDKSLPTYPPVGSDRFESIKPNVKATPTNRVALATIREARKITQPTGDPTKKYSTC